MKVRPQTDIGQDQPEPSPFAPANQDFLSWWQPAGWGAKAGFMPLPALFLAILILWLADIQTAYESTAVLLLSNVVLTFFATLLISWMAGCAFLASGHAHLIILGCGALTWGLSNVLASALFARDPNLGITVHNLGALCSAAFHLAGMALKWPIQVTVNNRVFWLALGYPSGLLPISVISVTAVTQQLPTFFIPGVGGTPIRQVVLACSVLCFVASSWLVLKLLRKTHSRFLYWYGLALALLAVGLLGVMLQNVPGSPLGWTGRTAQLLGAVYLLVAGFSAHRELGGWKLVLNVAEGEPRPTPQATRAFMLAARYGTAIAVVGIAYGLRLVLTMSLGPGLPLYVTFFPAVMIAAMLAGFGPGLLAAFLSALILWQFTPFMVGPTGVRSAAERLGLLLFLGTSAFLSLVAEFYRQSQRKAAAYDRAIALQASEEALRQSEEQFRKIFEHAATGIVITSVKGLVERCNPAYESITGYKESELHGESFTGLFYPEDRETYDALIGHLLTGEMPHFQIENRYRRKDGATVWVQSAVSTLRNESGIPAHVIGLARDITEAKAARDLLRESEARLRIAKSAAQLGIFDHDLVTGGLTCDERARELLNAQNASTSEELLAGLHPMDRALARDAMKTALCPDSGGTFNFECRVPGQRSSSRWLASTGQVLFSQGRPVRLVGTVQDITQRREFQIELERLVAERTSKLQELVSDLEHFSYSITHDMRAPLRAMKGYGEFLVDLCPECPNPQRKNFLQRIIAAADRMDCLIVDALNYSRAVRQEIPLGSVDAGRLLRGMLDSYPELQPDHADIQILGELPLVLANEAGLTQCFSNLLANAVKFVLPGERAKVRIHGETSSDTVRIWIEDNGIGIPEAMMPKLFGMFSRGQTTHEGTGIGLALVRKVLHRMGGKVGVESVVGQGSRFWIELRAVPEMGTEDSTILRGPLDREQG